MKRYGRRVITLKDMLVEFLMEHMEDVTFDRLKKELGASLLGLEQVVQAMMADGELIKVKLPTPERLDFLAWETIQPTGSAYSSGFSVKKEINHVTGEPVSELPLSPEELVPNEAVAETGRATLTGRWHVTSNNEVFKVSPRMWIEEVSGI